MSTRFLTTLEASLGLVLAAVALSPGLQAQGPPPEVYSANNAADYSTSLAPGSLFVVFGYGLGPETLTGVTLFPLPKVLAGTSVTVTSGATVLDCPMIYTSNTQVAAILPSTTAAGTATITVTYNGVTYPDISTTQITVTSSSIGIFTPTATGLGQGIFTSLDASLKTYANSARPGEVLTAWATGAGPISTPDDVLPTAFASFLNVQVWVGGQSAALIYAGPSGCCAALDQIAFTVPANVATGCNVPVLIVGSGYASNSVTLPVNASGGACSDSGPTVPTSILTRAAAGQPLKMALIAVGPTTITGAGAEPRSLAGSLSTALHTPVPEADAARIIRAYRTRSSKAIRSAMAKYATRWKALDARTKNLLTAQIGLAQEGILAEFGSISSEAVPVSVDSAQLPSAGACQILPNSFPFGLGGASAGLDAGSSLMLTGAAGSLTLKQNGTGQYEALFGSSIVGPNIPIGTYTISGSGGKDVGAFSSTITIASHLAISNKASLTTIDRTQPLTVTWTGGTAGHYVLLGGGATRPPHAYFVCAEDGGKGTFTIPAYILSSIQTTPPANGILWLSANPLANPITIPNVDAAYFTDASSDSVNVTFGKMNAGSGANVTNVTGSIDGLYPSPAAGPVTYSALLTAGTFTTSFDIVPGASPFNVRAVSPAGSAIISINPAQNTWQATYIVPTAAARSGDFNSAGFVVTNFMNNMPFPNNLIPLVFIDSLAASALSALPLPTATPATGANGTWSASGSLPASGHFTVGAGTSPPPAFGGFTNVLTRGASSVNFSLYVDGQLISSKQVSYVTD